MCMLECVFLCVVKRRAADLCTAFRLEFGNVHNPGTLLSHLSQTCLQVNFQHLFYVYEADSVFNLGKLAHL